MTVDPHDFGRRQMELTAAFAEFVLAHPEVDEKLPEDVYIYFEVAGESEFNRYSKELAHRRQHEEGMRIVCVKTKGLDPLQGSRLIDPVIEAPPTVA